MLASSVARLRCPRCHGELKLRAIRLVNLGAAEEISSGELLCPLCAQAFPILAGVAVLVEDPDAYLIEHVKGVSALVSDDEIPKEIRDEYVAAKAELEPEHIEEDLEADRVTALYIMNHYLSAREAVVGVADPIIADLIRRHWDNGPLARIEQWLGKLDAQNVIELGCGVGGLARGLKQNFLGVDSSFASIALARHLTLGAHYPRPIRVPLDLLTGPLAREIKLPTPPAPDGRTEFVVGDLAAPPAQKAVFDVAIALNAIDMLPEPADLPRAQSALLKPGGTAIQSCPYIWHSEVANLLRERLPANVRDSARAVEWLYEQEGFTVGESADHVPWLFFKHARQLEIYSVHLFQATR